MKPMASRRIPISHPVLSGNEKQYVNECHSAWITSQGKFIELFEREFAGFCGADYAVACNNGTTSLNAAMPVFAGSERLTKNLNPEFIEDRITPRTKDISSFNFYYHPAATEPMLEIARRRGLSVLEDAEVHLMTHRRLAGWYHRQLSHLRGVLLLQVELDWAHHAYWLFTVQLRETVALHPDEVMPRLAGAGIETRPIFCPMHVLPPYREPDRRYPAAEAIAARSVSLPVNGLLTEEDVAYAATQLKFVCHG